MLVEMEAVLKTVRAIAMALPMATEKMSHGEPTWFVDGKKSFAMFCNHHHGLPLGVWCAASLEAQQAFIASDPVVFYRPPYVGVRGWIGINLEEDSNWEELADILEQSYRHVAPPKYLKLLDEQDKS
jgi:hypothetical protein